jgi:ecotin
MKLKLLVLLLTLSSISKVAFTAPHSQLKAFPSATANNQRFVITLPAKPQEESLLKVELIVGKAMQTDGVNHHWLLNSIEEKTLEGWGYNYYQIDDSENVASTRMAPLINQAPITQFVTAAPLLIRYNSSLPIVVYAPLGYEVKYRIWSALETLENASKE